MKTLLVPTAAAAAIFLAGCASTPAKPAKPVNPPTAAIQGKLVTGQLSVMCDKPADCKTFDLVLTNATAQPLEIDWNRSYYLNNGQPDGGLYFDGIVVAQRNMPRPPDIILPSSTFKKTLAPNNSLEMKVFPLAYWDTKVLKGPSHGIYLTLNAKGQEEIINVSVDVPQK